MEIVAGKGNSGHVAVHGQTGKAHFVLLRIVRAPGHGINRTDRRHRPLQQGLQQGLEQQRDLGGHGEAVGCRGRAGVATHQLMQIGGATAPVADHHHRIIRNLQPLQPLAVDQLLHPAQRFGGQSGDGERQELVKLRQRRPTVLKTTDQHRRPGKRTGDDEIGDCRGRTGQHAVQERAEGFVPPIGP